MFQKGICYSGWKLPMQLGVTLLEKLKKYRQIIVIFKNENSLLQDLNVLQDSIITWYVVFYLFVDIVSILCEFQDAILKKMETFMTHTQIPYHIWWLQKAVSLTQCYPGRSFYEPFSIWSN